MKKYPVRWFWRRQRAFGAQTVTSTLCAQVFIQYQINVWNRAIFDALEQRNAGAVAWQELIFIPLALASIPLAVSISSVD